MTSMEKKEILQALWAIVGPALLGWIQERLGKACEKGDRTPPVVIHKES